MLLDVSNIQLGHLYVYRDRDMGEGKPFVIEPTPAEGSGDEKDVLALLASARQAAGCEDTRPIALQERPGPGSMRISIVAIPCSR